MPHASSRRVVYAALAGNLLIAVTKLVASFFTGSSAMLSEAIHSFIDTGDQGLLLLGMRRATRPADSGHPFGHGPELYFWSFVVAIMIFALGGGVSIYEGIAKLRSPEALDHLWISYAVLGLAFCFEGWSLRTAIQEFRKEKGGDGWLRAVRRSKDPTVFTVLLEDSAALLGLIFAFAGIALGQLLDLPMLDGVAAVLIGCLLLAVAVFLANETRSLLTGEAAHPALVAALRHQLGSDPTVAGVNAILTMHLGPRDILLAASLDFKDGLDSGAVEAAVEHLDAEIKRAHPEVTRIFVEARRGPASETRPPAPAPSGPDSIFVRR